LLVVDDDAGSREALTTYLRACGAAVLTAHTGRGALVYIEAAPRLDAIVTDISMPGMDGVEFVRAIRRHHAHSRRNVPVVAVTGHDADEFPASEFDAYVRKPVDPDEVCRAIELAIARRRNS
jgi:CheY-like chemotaxis protein